MPTLAPIQGNTTMKVGSVTTFTDATPSGAWSSTNTAIATVNSGTGVVTAVSAGNCQIVYTVGSDSTAINITVQSALSLTNGVDFNKVYPALQNRVLFQSQGLISDSNRYYEDFHPLCDTELIDQMRPSDNSSLTTYLANKQRSIILDLITAIYNRPQVIDKPKLCFWRSDMPLPIQIVKNSGGFVGLRFYVGKGDHTIKLNSLILFFTKAVSFNLYLYNDFFLDPFMTIPVTANAYEETIIDLGETLLLSNLVPTAYKGGRWYLGYWQDDLGDSEAIYYPCGYNVFKPLEVLAFSAPVWTDPNGNKNFNRNNIGSNNLMYGLNAEISTFINATNTIVQNAHLFDTAMGYMMAERIVKDFIFSYRSNSDQRNIQGIPELGKLYAELNGFKADEEIPYVLGLKDQVNRSLKTLKDALQENVTHTIGTA